MYKKVTKVLVTDMPWVPGTNLPNIPIPTDAPISKIVLRLAGTPSGATVGAGTRQNPLWPAVCNLIGNITLEGTPKDGVDGLQVRNVPAGLFWFRNWMMKAVQPETQDINAAALASALFVTVPINFMDERLPLQQQLATALDARRYGGGDGSSAFNLKIQTGNLTAANGSKLDLVALVGGNYTNPAAGSLTLTVSVEQLVPLAGGKFPTYKDGDAVPFLDLNIEYNPLIAATQAQSNSLALQTRGLQAETYFFDVDRDANQIETPVNNLGISPNNQIVQKLGAQPWDVFDPKQLRADDLARYLAGAASFPDGCYVVNDWSDDLTRVYHLYNESATHAYDLNMGASSQVDSVIRVFHVTYNPSRRARQVMNVQGV